MIGLRIDDREVRRALRQVRDLGEKAIADALNRTAFEILDAEERHVRSIFDFSGPNTANFLARGFQFKKATARNLVVKIFTRPGRDGRIQKILVDHARGAGISAGDGGRLTYAGKLAIPIGVKRGARGKVRKNQRPSAVIKAGGFVSGGGRSIMRRRKGSLEVVYALVDRAKLRKRLQFLRVVQQTARREFPKKAARVVEKAIQRRQR